MDLSKAYTLIEPLTLQLSRAWHHKGLHWIKKNNNTTSNTYYLAFWLPTLTAILKLFSKTQWMWLLCVLCGCTMILACHACRLWEHKYRAGCIGHDQSIQAGKSEWSTDIIKSQTLGLQRSRYGLQNGRDRGVWWNMWPCASLKDKIILDVGW